MNIRIPRSGQAARIAKAFLKTQGIEVKHIQALELVARLHGYTDAQAMKADHRFDDAPTLRADSNNEFTLVGPKQTSVWVRVDNISVHVKKDDEGVAVDLFAKGAEDTSLTGTWLLYQDAQPSCKVCGNELDAQGYCLDDTCAHSDWPQSVERSALQELSTEQTEKRFGVKKRVRSDSFVTSDRIKREYLASACSRHDVEHALARMGAECADIFESPTAMWEFLMEETHEDNEPGEAATLATGDIRVSLSNDAYGYNDKTFTLEVTQTDGEGGDCVDNDACPSGLPIDASTAEKTLYLQNALACVGWQYGSSGSVRRTAEQASDVAFKAYEASRNAKKPV